MQLVMDMNLSPDEVEAFGEKKLTDD